MTRKRYCPFCDDYTRLARDPLAGPGGWRLILVAPAEEKRERLRGG